MNGICHVEIHTTDLDATEAFVTSLFGWKVTEMSPEYRVFETGAGPGGGLEKVSQVQGKSDIQMYIEVESIEQTLERAVSMGGSTATPKTEIGGGHGFFAHLTDPGGSTYGLWQASE